MGELDKIKDMMFRIDESYRNCVLSESEDDFETRWIKELNDMYKEDGTYGIKLYHRAGMHSWGPFDDVVRSICKNGLTVGSATDGDGIGKCIWFSSDFEEYGKNGQFVLSVELTGENKVKFGINYEGRISYASKDIPFEYLTVEVIPLYKDFMRYFTNVNAESNAIKKMCNGSSLEMMLKTAKNFPNKDVIMYVDAWDYMGIPYDLERVKEYDNIKIEKFGLPV